jgi:hypothetical protein
MQARVDTIMANLNGVLKEVDAVKDRPQALAAAIRGTATDPPQLLLDIRDGKKTLQEAVDSLQPNLRPVFGDVLGSSFPFAVRLRALRRYYEVVSSAIASIFSERGIIDLQRKEMASRVQSLAAKTEQFAILKTTKSAAIALSQIAQGTESTIEQFRKGVDLLLKENDSGAGARPLTGAELAFLRDFRRIQARVGVRLYDIKRDCDAIDGMLSTRSTSDPITLGAVEDAAQLLSSISHNLSQLAPEGLFDAVTFPPQTPSSPCEAFAKGWMSIDQVTGLSTWRLSCFRSRWPESRSRGGWPPFARPV